MPNDFLKNILTDLKVELLDEFDRNFERKAFFGSPWPQSLVPNKRGSLMMRSGALRKSIRARVSGNALNFSSSLPYAKIQNEGGVIVVTRKMQKFFWAMYYSLVGKITYNIKTKSANYNKKTQAISQEAMYWRAMALKKVGSKIVIKERRFIGSHPQVHQAVKRVVDANFSEIEKQIRSALKPHS